MRAAVAGPAARAGAWAGRRARAWAGGRVGRGAAVAVGLGVRAHRCLWPPGPARLADPRLRNRACLRDRLIALPLLALLTFGCLGWSYTAVRGDLGEIRERLGPALVDLAQARVSVQIAHAEARNSLRSGGTAELAGLNEKYRRRLSRTTQSLAHVGQNPALTVPERQEVRVVSALLVDYGGWISRAQGHAGDKQVRTAELGYARGMMCATADDEGLPTPKPDTATADEGRARAAPGAGVTVYPRCLTDTGFATTIVERTAVLERQLQARVARRAAWGGGTVAAAAVGAGAGVLLGVGLWRTEVFLRVRFRLRVGVPLAVAALPLAALAVLAVDGALAQHAQGFAVRRAAALAERTSPSTEDVAEHGVSGKPPADAIEVLADRLEGGLASGRLAFCDHAAPLVWPAGVATAVLLAAALHGYRREYLLVGGPGAAS